jgi:DNA mismatch repair ATPase MutS
MNIVNTNYSNRCSILSGPNGAGKTIYMKQVAMIIYLAHCGFYVPATFAEIPLTDRIVFAQSSSSLYSEKTGFENELYSLSKIMNKSIFLS